MQFTFSKEERLCSRTLIDRLYNEGHRMMAFPYSVMWLSEPSLQVPCQVMIVAPKRRFHHAVDRNRIKRLTRECYRHLKPALYSTLQENNMHITLALVYVHNEILPYQKLEQKMDKLMAQLSKEIADEKNRLAAE